MNVNEFAKDVHENAVAHGWWDTARSFPEVAALIHSEVSEALEEWRDGNPAIYGCCGIPGAVCEFEGACDKGEKTGTCKPEGVAVELCDAVIRIFDYLAYLGVDVEAVLTAKLEYNKGREYRHGGKRAYRRVRPLRDDRPNVRDTDYPALGRRRDRLCLSTLFSTSKENRPTRRAQHTRSSVQDLGGAGARHDMRGNSRRLFGGYGVVLPNARRAQDRRFQNRVRPRSRRLLGRRNESKRL